MGPDRISVPALAVLVAAALGTGCGLGPGDSTDGEATLTVTRDYGTEPDLEASVSDPTESETVMRFLDREADITTRYGGGFVQAISGVEGTTEGDRTLDWFFYVNGIESPVGAAEVSVRAGDRIWWDYRDWTEAMRVPAVVGSWPEPFLQASAGEKRVPVRIACGADPAPCDDAKAALSEDGVNASIEPLGEQSKGDAMRLLVGGWDEIASDPAARLLERAPEASGVFARVEGGEISMLDVTGEVTGTSDGLVAATRVGEDLPTWLVTGTTEEGLADAVRILDDDFLADHYAVATAGGRSVPLPVTGGAP